MADAVPHAAPIHFQFRLAGSASADAPRQPRHRRAVSGEAWQEVPQLRELHLQLALTAVRPPAEDVENQLGPVDDLQVGHGGDGRGLRGRQILIEDEVVHPVLQGLDDDLLELATAQQVLGMQRLGPLNDRVQHHEAGRAGQFGQLRQRLFLIRVALPRHADQNRLLLEVVHEMDGAGPAQLLVEGAEKFAQADLAVLRGDWRPDLVGFAGRIRREDVRRIQMAWLAVGAHAEGRDQVQAQERQVGQVVLTQRFVAQMRVDQPNAAERLPAEAIVREVGQDDLSVVPDDDVLDHAPTIDEQADLAPDLAGEPCAEPGQLPGDDGIFGHPAAVDMLQPPQLVGLEPREITVRRRNRAPSLRSSASDDPVRSGFKTQGRDPTFTQQPCTGYGDHGAVVSAIANRGNMDGDPFVAPARLEPSPKLRVGGHAACYHDVTHTAALGGGQRFLHQDVHDGLLEPSRHVRHMPGTPFGLPLPQVIQ